MNMKMNNKHINVSCERLLPILDAFLGWYDDHIYLLESDVNEQKSDNLVNKKFVKSLKMEVIRILNEKD